MNRAASGFTLLEVMVAMAVLAIAMAALVRTAITQVDNTGYLETKTFAHWAASNQLVERAIADPWPAIGTKKGTTKMGNQAFDWSIKTNTTPFAELRRLDINLFPEGSDDSIVELSRFIAKK